MINRLIVAIQILSITACPFWCDAGVCAGGDCSSVQTSASTASLFPSNKCACCCHSPLDRQSSEHGPLTPDSEQPSCQGICGGAILEQLTELTDADSTVDAVLVVLADVSGLRQSLDLFSCEILERDSVRSPHGRLLRVMYQSFQC